MRAVMHQDREPELARADDAHRQQKVSGLGHHATSAIDPNISAHACAIRAMPFQRHALAHGDQLILVQEVAGTHAKRGHDDLSLSGESESEASRSPTRRSRVLSSAILAVA